MAAPRESVIDVIKELEDCWRKHQTSYGNSLSVEKHQSPYSNLFPVEKPKEFFQDYQLTYVTSYSHLIENNNQLKKDVDSLLKYLKENHLYVRVFPLLQAKLERTSQEICKALPSIIPRTIREIKSNRTSVMTADQGLHHIISHNFINTILNSQRYDNSIYLLKCLNSDKDFYVNLFKEYYIPLCGNDSHAHKDKIENILTGIIGVLVEHFNNLHVGENKSELYDSNQTQKLLLTNIKRLIDGENSLAFKVRNPTSRTAGFLSSLSNKLANQLENYDQTSNRNPIKYKIFHSDSLEKAPVKPKFLSTPTRSDSVGSSSSSSPMKPSTSFNSTASISRTMTSAASGSSQRPALSLFDEVEKDNVQALRDARAKGVNLSEIKTDIGFTLLHVAARMGNMKCAKFLLNTGVNINARNINGTTPLYLAVEQTDENMINLLLERGALDNLKKGNEKETLRFAFKTCHHSTYKHMVDFFPPTLAPQERDTWLLSFDEILGELDTLLRAIRQDYLVMLKEYGRYFCLTNPITINDKKTTLLHYAAEHGALDCVRFLVEERGMDPNYAINNIYEIPLLVAMKANQEDVITYLTSKTTKDPLNNIGIIAIQISRALEDGEIQTANNMIQNFTEGNERKTHLLLSTVLAMNLPNSMKTINVILGKDTSRLNYVFDDGKYAGTLLHDIIVYVSDKKYTEEKAEKILGSLLNHPGINLDLRDRAGRTAEELANDKGFVVLATMLKSYKEEQEKSTSLYPKLFDSSERLPTPSAPHEEDTLEMDKEHSGNSVGESASESLGYPMPDLTGNPTQFSTPYSGACSASYFQPESPKKKKPCERSEANGYSKELLEYIKEIQSREKTYSDEFEEHCIEEWSTFCCQINDSIPNIPVLLSVGIEGKKKDHLYDLSVLENMLLAGDGKAKNPKSLMEEFTIKDIKPAYTHRDIYDNFIYDAKMKKEQSSHPVP